MLKNNGKLFTALAMTQLLFLSVQFIVGMWINLFAPAINTTLTPSPMQFMMLVVFSEPEAMTHMIVGIMIGILALIMIAFSLFSGEAKIIILSFADGILTLVAGISGMLFLFSYMSNNFLSFSMSIAFVGVILTDFSIVYYSSRYNPGKSGYGFDPLSIMKNGYAKGEISKEEYDRMREDLGK
ncbi:MAG: SHOCT domain-containing protein [Thermoplasmatales archaeon]|nr:SHOCT domain-containing protein [Thermoplasmatales archaeon]